MRAVPSGLQIPATQIAQLAAGAWLPPAGATEPGPPPGALKFLQQAAGGARPPGQGGKAKGQRQAGESIAEQLGQQEQGCAGWLASRSRLICRAA